MAAVLPASAKRTNKGRFCTAKAIIRNNNAANRLTASWFVIEKQENERNVRDPEVCGGFSLRDRRVVELLKCPGWGFGLWGAVRPVGQLYGSPTALTSQYLAWDRYCTYVVQTPRVERRIFLEHILLYIETKQANIWRTEINSLFFKFLCQALLCESQKNWTVAHWN